MLTVPMDGAGTSGPSLHVDGLSKRYGKITALDELTLDLEGPTIVGLVGPNGAGKTTLIKVLLGLVAPDAGEVEVFGRRPSELFGSGGPRVGYMPQGLAIYLDLTVRENVTFFARLHRIDRATRAQAVEQAVATVGLSDRVDDPVAELSGGMQRRVSLASTIVHSPELLVLDEPTVGVDPELRSRMWSAFRDLRDEGSLLLLSTHYLGEAGRCDVVVFLRQGRVLAVDTPDALLARTGTDELEEAFLALAGAPEGIA